MAQQTAVIWFIENYEALCLELKLDLSMAEFNKRLTELFNKAKQMEREQIRKAYEEGWQYGWHGIEHIDSEQYYKKTYED